MFDARLTTQENDLLLVKSTIHGTMLLAQSMQFNQEGGALCLIGEDVSIASINVIFPPGMYIPLNVKKTHGNVGFSTED